MSILIDAMSDMPENDSVIGGTLRRWEQSGITGRYVVPNLGLEQFLDPSSMTCLLRAVIYSDSSEISQLEENYKNECHKHCCQGGTPRIDPMPRRIGRAVEYDTFVNYLFDKQPAVFPTREQVIAFIDKLIRGELLDSIEKTIVMSSGSRPSDRKSRR